MSAVGALLGLAMGMAGVMVLGGILAARRPRLAARLRGPVRSRAEQGPLAALTQVVGTPLMRAIARPGSDLAGRLRRSGRDVDPDRFRLEGLVWASVGAVVGGIAGIAMGWRNSGFSPAAVGALLLVGAAGGWMMHDRSLSRAAKQRAVRMAEQLPTVAELIAFAVAAGEAPLAAIDRVASTVKGELASEFAAAVRRVRGGSTFPGALRDMSDAVPSLDVARFVDGIAVASERGTPLADVLRAQAADARASGRRLLLEKAARKEVLMLVPVVFFILPIVVVIALYPGIHGLQLTVS